MVPPVPLQLDISPAEQNALAEANAKAEATAADPARAVDTHGLATERAVWEAHANATFPGRDLPGRELDCAEEYDPAAGTSTPLPRMPAEAAGRCSAFLLPTDTGS